MANIDKKEIKKIPPQVMCSFPVGQNHIKVPLHVQGNIRSASKGDRKKDKPRNEH